LLAALGLDRHFEVIVISCEVGSSKPERGMFDAAAGLFKLSPGEICHVGDSAEADEHGARAAGFAAARIVRSGVRDAATLGSLLDLGCWLESPTG
jgi:putative hydrolase of the HAD superfamily